MSNKSKKNLSVDKHSRSTSKSKSRSHGSDDTFASATMSSDPVDDSSSVSDSESLEAKQIVPHRAPSKPKKRIKKKTKISGINTNNEIFKELIRKQLIDVPAEWKLGINDIKRICKYIYESIFDKEKCCIWNGYVTNMNNTNKGTYVNFYFKNKKVALHRLLYSNFVAPLDSSEYLKFNCNNKGICCSVGHYEKYKYSKNKREPTAPKDKPVNTNKPPEPKPKPTHDDQTASETENSDDLIIEFD